MMQMSKLIQTDFDQRSGGPYGLQACVFISLSFVEEFLTLKKAPPAIFTHSDPHRYQIWLISHFKNSIDKGILKHQRFCEASM